MFEEIIRDFGMFFPGMRDLIDESKKVKYIGYGEYLIQFIDGNSLIYDEYYHSVRTFRKEYELNDNLIKKEFSYRLRKIMRDRKVDQNDLAKMTDISQPQISKYISGNTAPNIITLRKLAKALNCELNDFIYDRED